jgi:phenylacetate-coenzyme A ligase PaaK-like adenylate-forming protein
MNTELPFSPAAIFEIDSSEAFESKALQVFYYQYEAVSVYRQFCDLLKKTPASVNALDEIPFLPIEFFKSHTILSENATVDITFSSSGTTGQQTSKHHVADLQLYEKSFTKGFEHFFGPVDDLTILALLPSYLEREGSSLIYMVDALLQQSKSAESNFYLNDTDTLIDTLLSLETTGRKTLLLGVSFALLDLVEKHSLSLQHTKVMETGGMKGRRKELIREALHQELKKGFTVDKGYGEYGMTELLSQAYSMGDGRFSCPPWMKILIRNTEDPFQLLTNKTGGINVIDLANIHSCSFIATQDLGKAYQNGTFEVLGRFDNSDVRGCNLLVL